MKKLIGSISTAILLTLLLITTIFAWFATNKVVSANNISGIAANTNIEVEYVFEYYSEITSTWISVNDVDTPFDMGNLYPGKFYSFRVIIADITHANKKASLTMKFGTCYKKDGVTISPTPMSEAFVLYAVDNPFDPEDYEFTDLTLVESGFVIKGGSITALGALEVNFLLHFSEEQDEDGNYLNSNDYMNQVCKGSSLYIAIN